jgi:hypothetical protein
MTAFRACGDMYLAASTYYGIGRGRVTLRPEWVSGIATVLGIPADDLAALTGIDVSDAAVRENPVAAEMAELIWNLRRLSAPQTKYVREQAESMLVIVPEGAARGQWNRLYCIRGIWWGTAREQRR